MKLPDRIERILKHWVGPGLILVVYLLSASYVARIASSGGGKEAVAEGRKVIRVAQEDNLYMRFFPTLNGDTMDRYDLWMWGISEYMYIYYALLDDALDLKQDRIRAAFCLIKEVYRQCQPSFLSDLAEQKRFLFIQGKAAMVTGNTRDLGIYLEFADFEVGVFDFPV